MGKKYNWLVALILTISTVSVSANERTAIWQSLQDVDRSFAEDARRYGSAEAFLRYLAHDAVVFRRGPVSARQIYQSVDRQRNSDRLVESRAHYFDFSRAGDLGLIAGPFRSSQGTGKELTKSNGYFISIWRQLSGSWILEADIAISIPGVLSIEVEPAIQESNRAFLESPDVVNVSGNSFNDVIAAESDFVSAINYRGGRRAILQHGLENQRVYVPGMAPAIGRDSAALAYGMFLDDTLSMALLKHESLGGAISASGELAYTYGTMGSESSKFNTNYLRLWRYTTEGDWKIAVEVLNPY
jgi:ketosteroid isomerase-like protein